MRDGDLAVAHSVHRRRWRRGSADRDSHGPRQHGPGQYGTGNLEQHGACACPTGHPGSD